MKKINTEKVVEGVQDSLDSVGDFWVDLYEIIDSCDGLTSEEKDWARDNLSVALVVVVMSPQEVE